MTRTLLPPPCKSGDQVAIIAPAGPFREQWLQLGCERLQQWGLVPVYEPSLFSQWGYLAGEDTLRLRTLAQAFADPKISAILCARGGYGTMRLLPQLPWEDIAKTPKRFVGFSDLTTILNVLAARAGLISFHGPMIASQLFLEGTPESLQRLQSALFAPSLQEACPPLPGETLRPGKAKGRLLGGNLSLIAATMGTPYQPDFREAILFLEDVSEPPYRIDRMLQQLSLAGVLDQLNGLVLGDFGALSDQYTTYAPEEFWLERLNLPQRLPILHQVPFGHVRDNYTLPVGTIATLDATKGSLSFDPL